MNVYVASSWRNERQPEVVETLISEGFEVYDFRNPEEGDNGFHWSEIDPNWENWSPESFKACLAHPIAEECFSKDMTALKMCDVCVLVLPCGRSAHLEAGWALGSGKKVIILLSDGEPELMYKMTDYICTSIEEVINRLHNKNYDLEIGG